MEEGEKFFYRFFSGGGFAQIFTGALLGALSGGIFGIAFINNKTFQLEGMTDSEIQETLYMLHKKARVPNYK